MTVTYGFYNSLNGDRKYNALQFSRLFEGIIRDGVFATVGQSLIVSAAGGMTVNVGTGRAWFNNTWTNNDAILPLNLDQSEAILNRIDAVVLEIASSNDKRENSIKIIKGTPATTPSNPTLIKTMGLYQYPLAYIYVDKGTNEITQAKITNKVGSNDCPFITGVLQTISAEELVLQWEDQFNQWFATVKDQITGDMVTIIQNRIDAIISGETVVPEGGVDGNFLKRTAEGTLWINPTKSDVGLDQVDNTKDSEKPVSQPQQAALNLKANLNSPTFTGIPKAPTAVKGTNTTQLATTQFVQDAMTGFTTISSVEGMIGRTTTISGNQIIETLASGHTKTTTFNANGTITETFAKSGEVTVTKITTFNPDGSISEVIS